MERGEIIARRGTSEDMFLAWLFGLPEGTNVADAARSAIARIDAASDSGEQLGRLRKLLLQATLNQPATPRQRCTRRH
jgi:hypothetical protein